MTRYSSTQYAFGPGPVTPAVRAIIVANIIGFLLVFLFRPLTIHLGLTPAAVLEDLWLWQPITYMFVHSPGSVFHILFNMLLTWMIGVELERLWGTAAFLRFWFVTGIGAGLTTIAVSLLPFAFAGPVYYSVTIGASGAVYGLLLAFAMHYPNRPMLFFPIPVPVPAKYFVLILGAIAFFSSFGASNSGVAHATHLGGLIAGYLYLISGRPGGLTGELKYRWLKWRMARTRKKFDVLSGGRGGGRWDGRVH